METIYCGLLAENGYLLATNDAADAAEGHCAIVQVNARCAALIVTTQAVQGDRARTLLEDTLSHSKTLGEGISRDSVMGIVKPWKLLFRKEPQYAERPLTFLMLFVGYTAAPRPVLETIFVRNRVVKSNEKRGVKKYATRLEVHKPAAAENMFYGHSSVCEYLSRQVAPASLTLAGAALLASFAVAESQRKKGQQGATTRMAVLEAANGFRWIGIEESKAIGEKALELKHVMRERILPSFFNEASLAETR
jgi:hypothetical protein